jgi:hypothetical protein
MAFRELRAGEIDIHDRRAEQCNPIRQSGALERFDIASSFYLPPFTLLADGTYVRGSQMISSVKNILAFTLPTLLRLRRIGISDNSFSSFVLASMFEGLENSFLTNIILVQQNTS